MLYLQQYICRCCAFLNERGSDLTKSLCFGIDSVFRPSRWMFCEEEFQCFNLGGGVEGEKEEEEEEGGGEGGGGGRAGEGGGRGGEGGGQRSMR